MCTNTEAVINQGMLVDFVSLLYTIPEVITTFLVGSSQTRLCQNYALAETWYHFSRFSRAIVYPLPGKIAGSLAIPLSLATREAISVQVTIRCFVECI